MKQGSTLLISQDGHEQQLQINYLSHFLLTSRVMPRFGCLGTGQGEGANLSGGFRLPRWPSCDRFYQALLLLFFRHCCSCFFQVLLRSLFSGQAAIACFRHCCRFFQALLRSVFGVLRAWEKQIATGDPGGLDLKGSLVLCSRSAGFTPKNPPERNASVFRRAAG